MLPHASAYDLEGLDALDLQLVLEMDDNHAEYDTEETAPPIAVRG